MSSYEIASLIIGAVGAVATFSAVVVALWQTKYANRKKLKCSFSDNIIIADNYNNMKKYVGMIITNIGNKRVIINSWSVKTKNGYLRFLTDLSGITDSDILDRRLSAEMKLPHVLETEEQFTFYFPYDLFCKNINNVNYHIFLLFANSTYTFLQRSHLSCRKHCRLGSISFG